MSKFCCPVCGEKLEISGKSYVCSNGHCFDLAKSGYVNLLLSKQHGKTTHGADGVIFWKRDITSPCVIRYVRLS